MGLPFVFYSFGGIYTSEPQGCSSCGNIYDKHYTRNVLSARDADLERASWAWSRCGVPSRIPRKWIPFPLPNAAHFGFSLALATTLVQPHHLRTRERERITSIRDWFISSSFDLFSRFKERPYEIHKSLENKLSFRVNLIEKPTRCNRAVEFIIPLFLNL